MNETTTAHIELTAQYDIYQSYQAELREAKGDLETGRYRQALAGAHRAWEYYGEFVLVMLGKTKGEIDDISKGLTLGLHEREHRRYYEERTDDSLAAQASWSELFQSKELRGKAEHRGKPVSEAEASEAIKIRLGLMRHIDGVLARASDVDQDALRRASEARDAVV